MINRFEDWAKVGARKPSLKGGKASNWIGERQVSGEIIALPVFFLSSTMVQKNQESRLMYWTTGSSVRSFACTATVFLLRTARFTCVLCCIYSFARSLTSELVGKWMIRWLFSLCFFCSEPKCSGFFLSSFLPILHMNSSFLILSSSCFA